MKCMNFDFNFTDVTLGSKQWYPSIGSDNGLVPLKLQAIVWTNAGQFTDAYLHH